jgi:hypothetical protein
MKRVGQLVAASLLCGFYLGCADLPPISVDVCGNGVVEPDRGEDCDGKGPAGSKCGAPDTAHACRFLCTVQKDCPTGFGCGVDGLCRASSGTWLGPAGITGHTVEPPLDVIVADSDGDGKADVFSEAAGSITIDYDVTTSTVAEQILPRDAILPVVSPIVDLSGDHRADAVIPTDLGFFASLGTPTRTERATAYTSVGIPDDVSDVQAFTAELLPEQPGLENIVIAMLTLPGFPTTPSVINVSSYGALSLIGQLPDTPAHLAGPPLAGRLNEDDSVVPCEELVFGYRGKSSIDLMVPCQTSPQGAVLRENAQTTPIALPHGATIAGPLTIVDLDLDGHLDLLVPAARGSGFEIDVAYGRGDGTFASSPDAQSDGSAGVSVRTNSMGPLMAVADLDGDKHPDWVDPTGVYLSRGKDTPFPAAHNDVGGPWTSVSIAKLDGDELPDVAIGAKQAVVFLLNDGDSVFTPFPITVPGDVALLLPGDFDGDQVGDLALVTNAPAASSGPAVDTLSVIYGSPFGAPAGLKEIGEFHHINQLARGRAPAGEVNVVDGADDLGAIAQLEDGSLAFALILGRGDRRLRSPYDLAIPDVMQRSVTGFAPIRIVPADVDGDGVTDLVSLGQNVDDLSDFRIWATPMQGEASIRTSDCTHSDTLKPSFDWGHVLMGALDLDGQPGDELVFLGPQSDGSGHQYAIAHSAPAAMGGMGLTYSLGTPTKVAQTFTRSEQPLTDPSMHNGRMRIADIDQDGKNDVIALGQQGKNGTLVVFFNDGSGDLGTAVTVNNSDKLDIRDFAMTGTPADRKMRMVLLTTTGVYVVTAHGRELTAATTPALPMSAGTPTSPSLISTGDIDGDGLPDLALGGPLGYEVHLGISTNPFDFLVR